MTTTESPTPIDDGGPAFPCLPDVLPNGSGGVFQASAYGPLYTGLTLRDYFASQALQGLLVAGGPFSPEDMAGRAYIHAETMIQARKRSYCRAPLRSDNAD